MPEKDKFQAFQRAVSAVQSRNQEAVEQANKEAELLQQEEIRRNYNRLHNLPQYTRFIPSNGGTVSTKEGPLYNNKLEKYLDETASGQEMVRMANTAKKAGGMALGVAGGNWLLKGLKTAPLLTSGEFLGGALVGGAGQKVGKGADNLFHTRNQILDFEDVLPFAGMIGGAKAGRSVLENNTLRGAVEGFRQKIDKIPIFNYTIYHGGEFLGNRPNISKGDEFGFHVSTDRNVAQQLISRGESGSHKPISKNKGVIREGTLTTIGEPLKNWDWSTWSSNTPDYLFNGPKGHKFNERLLKRKGITYDKVKGYEKEWWKPEVAAMEAEANTNFAEMLKEHGIQAIEYPNVHEGTSINKSFAVIDPEAIVLDKHLISVPSAPKDFSSTYQIKSLALPFRESTITPEVKPYKIERYPGYQLKPLLAGNPLEKQLSKQGTISVNSIMALANKGRAIDKTIISDVLNSKQFAGKKVIDYNAFRKAIQNRLITYDRTPDTRYQKYGAQSLGLRIDDTNFVKNISDAKDYQQQFKNIDRYGSYEEKAKLTDLTHRLREGKISESEYDTEFNNLYNEMRVRYSDIPLYDTYTFSSSRIPNGSGKHYDPNTLGHSRTYTTADEPDVLHVMESQSDWAQSKPSELLKKHDIKSIADLDEEIAFQKANAGEGYKGVDWEDELAKLEAARPYVDPETSYLIDNYTSRQIQENLRYAAEKGQTKMRYPTRETAAKIEGYSKSRSQTLQDNPELQKKYDEMRDALRVEENRIVKKYAPEDYLDESLREADFGEMGLNEEETKQLVDRIRRSEEFERSVNGVKMRKEIIKAREKMDPDKWLIENVEGKYLPQHETILRKYDAFPKQYQKLYKGSDVRIITDSKGNTWYEVDVPENYLQQEWQMKQGGIIKGQKGIPYLNIPPSPKDSTFNIKPIEGVNHQYKPVQPVQNSSKFKQFVNKIKFVLDSVNRPKAIGTYSFAYKQPTRIVENGGNMS